ncbi:hypothetical protein T06_13020 [Trichinella sp. T6]|nr:hypothetical protein T06_13020 [Trichinella sp. T6]
MEQRYVVKNGERSNYQKIPLCLLSLLWQNSQKKEIKN